MVHLGFGADKPSSFGGPVTFSEIMFQILTSAVVSQLMEVRVLALVNVVYSKVDKVRTL